MAGDEEGEGSDFDTGFYEDRFKRFDELGEDQVSSMLFNGQMLLQDRDAAQVWLGRKSREHSKKSERNAISKSTIAIITIIVAIIGILITNLDAVRALFH